MEAHLLQDYQEEFWYYFVKLFERFCWPQGLHCHDHLPLWSKCFQNLSQNWKARKSHDLRQKEKWQHLLKLNTVHMENEVGNGVLVLPVYSFFLFTIRLCDFSISSMQVDEYSSNPVQHSSSSVYSTSWLIGCTVKDCCKSPIDVSDVMLQKSLGSNRLHTSMPHCSSI